MLKSRWLRLWLLAISIDATTVAAQPVLQTITLQEAHRMSMVNYPLIGASQEQVEQARQIRREARSLLLPLVSTQAVFTRNLVSAELEFEGVKLRVLPANDYNLSLVFSQPIFSGQRILTAKKQADIGVDVAGKLYETTAQDSLLEVTQAYYLVLAIQENIDITRRSVEVTAETLRTAESLFRAGESVETAVLRARVAHTDAQRELLEAQNNLKIAKEQLSVLTGIQGDFEVVRPERPQQPSASIDELVEMGFLNRPELQGLDLQEEIANLQIKRQWGQYIPNIRLNGTVIKRRSNFPSDTLGSLAINADWALFDGFRRASQVAAARSQLREVKLQRDLLHDRVEQQVRTAYLNIDTQTASVDMLEMQVAFARRNAESTQRAFRVGEATDLDILASNETLTRSERQLALATYQLELAIYELERAIGTFARDVIPAVSGENK
jgi:outer membrane protein